jgi:hypothetical protein
MSLTWPAKDPDEVADYDLDWTLRLFSAAELALYEADIEDGGDGSSIVPADTISTSTWLVATGSVTMDSDSKTTTATKLWLSGGTLGEACLLTNRIVTAGGRKFDASVKLRIKAK